RKHFTQASISGADVSEASIGIANGKGINNAIFKAYDGSKLPFEDNQFDVVFTSMVFHHI
ncbi:MAG: class I SAM-dependent methyltransferase, partial [Vicingaceae bacterium]